MKKVRWFRAIVLGAIALDLLLLAFVAVAFRYWPQLLIDIRYSLFAQPVAGLEVFRQPLDQMIAAGFLTDRESLRNEWRARLAKELPEFAAMPAGFESWVNVKKAQYLARLFSRDGAGEDFSQNSTLIDKLRRIREPFGKCSDHVEVFLALCSIHGVPAAEISITNHTIARIWSKAQEEWVYLDPQFCLMARGSDGRYLSILGLRENYFRGEDVRFEFFGNSSQRFAHGDPRQFAYYDRPDDFSDVILTFGNNVLEVDDYREHVRWIPKPIRQILFFFTGVMPVYQMVLDDRSIYARRIERIRMFTYPVGTIVVLLNAALPFALVAYVVRRRRLVREEAPTVVPPGLTPQT